MKGEGLKWQKACVIIVPMPLEENGKHGIDQILYIPERNAPSFPRET